MLLNDRAIVIAVFTDSYTGTDWTGANTHFIGKSGSCDRKCEPSCEQILLHDFSSWNLPPRENDGSNQRFRS
jgi:hypothetical protein